MPKYTEAFFNITHKPVTIMQIRNEYNLDHSRSLFIATLLPTFESILPHSKTSIVNESAATESTVNQIALLPVWVDSKFCALLKCHFYFTL